MYKLFTDKPETFQCSIQLQGASLSKSKIRLIVESNDLTLLFEGKIDNKGKCSVPIKKLNGLLNESSKGVMKLEVIAEDTYFTPWKSDFIVETSKKLTVEVVSQNQPVIKDINTPQIVVSEVSKPKVETKKPEPKKNIDHADNIMKYLIKEGFTITNLNNRKDRLTKILESYQKIYILDNTERSKLISEIINRLS
jgi:hypothetical protein